MLKIDFQKYFDGNDVLYYDSKYIITILEKMYKNNLTKIKEKVSNAKVIVSEEQN